MLLPYIGKLGGKMRIKMSRKEVIQMLISMAVVLFILLYFYGWIPPPHKEDPHIIAISDSWEFSSREEEPYTLCFLYKGTGTVPRRLKVRGVGFYEIVDKNKSIKKERGIDEYVHVSNCVSRNMPYGENRWYLRQVGPIETFQMLCCKITWNVDGESFSEYVISDSLSVEQIERIKEKWIESDSQDYDNPI